MICKIEYLCGNDIVSGANWSSNAGTYKGLFIMLIIIIKSISFTNPILFKTTGYAVGVTGQGMATGDYFTVTNKSVSGFDVAFFNSSNTGISKTFDFRRGSRKNI